MDTSCDNCIYAVFCEDKSVGIWAYVDDCICPFPSSKDIFEERGEDEDVRCSFFIERREQECQKIRCKECGSQHITLQNQNEHDETIEVFCDDCGALRTMDTIDLSMY
mgnify:CR=1 FL=1